jgi:hypothetical protein
VPFVLACFQVSVAPRLENPDSDEKDGLFGLDTQIIIFIQTFHRVHKNTTPKKTEGLLARKKCNSLTVARESHIFHSLVNLHFFLHVKQFTIFFY